MRQNDSSHALQRPAWQHGLWHRLRHRLWHGLRHKSLLIAALLLVFGAALSACSEDDNSLPIVDSNDEPTLDERMAAYEASLREEMNWLWEKLSFLQTHGRPEPDVCAAHDFTHPTVPVSEATDADDVTATRMIEHLDYARALLEQGHRQWVAFCDLDAAGGDTQVLLQSTLNGAANSLNIVLDSLERRERSRSR